MNTFATHKRQVMALNRRHLKYRLREFQARHFDYISDPKNFLDGVYFHQANSVKDRVAILRRGFDERLISEQNKGMGLGAGLYLGRDRKALINFYSEDFNNPVDCIIAVRGRFLFFDLTSNKAPKAGIKEFALKNGFDGVRYYDQDATGEEFVLYRYDKIISIT